MEPLTSGLLGALSFVVLPGLPLLLVFNVADDLGDRRVLTRLPLFSLGVVAVFTLSVFSIWASPDFFYANATKLDIVWGLLIVWLGFAVFRKKGTFIIRAARENFKAWCFGTFAMGMVFGSLWVNYLTIHDVGANYIYNSISFDPSIVDVASKALQYSFGLSLTVAVVGLITYFVAKRLALALRRHRNEVKMACGSAIMLLAAYLIFNDVWLILRFANLVL